MSLFEDENLHNEALKHLLIDAEIGPMDSARAIIECRISLREYMYDHSYQASDNANVLKIPPWSM